MQFVYPKMLKPQLPSFDHCVSLQMLQLHLKCQILHLTSKLLHCVAA
jgi:hypothetical protein